MHLILYSIIITKSTCEHIYDMFMRHFWLSTALVYEPRLAAGRYNLTFPVNSAIWTEEFEPQAWCRKFIFWIERTWRNTRMLLSDLLINELPSLRWGLESKRVTFSQISLSQLGRLGGMIIGGLFWNRRNLWNKYVFFCRKQHKL